MHGVNTGFPVTSEIARTSDKGQMRVGLLTKWLLWSSVEVRIHAVVRDPNGEWYIYSCIFILYVKCQSEVIRLFSVRRMVSIGRD